MRNLFPSFLTIPEVPARTAFPITISSIFHGTVKSGRASPVNLVTTNLWSGEFDITMFINLCRIPVEARGNAAEARALYKPRWYTRIPTVQSDPTY